MKAADAKILIIDDERDVRESITLLLQSQGLKNVDAASDAKAGMQKILKGKYDIVILDLIMPVISGHQVLKELKEKKVKTRVLVFSAVGLPNIVGTDVKSQYNNVGFMSKTAAADELAGRLKEMLKSPPAQL